MVKSRQVATLEKKKSVWEQLAPEAAELADSFINEMGINPTPFNRYFAKNCFRLVEGGWAKDPLPALKCLLDLAKTGKPTIGESGDSVRDILVELINAGFTPEFLTDTIRTVQREQVVKIEVAL
mgnify:CR=1 FL=1